jgi:hypothetical protein
VAQRFGELFQKAPIIVGQEADTALLNHAGQCAQLFGYPAVSADQMIEWLAQWISHGGSRLDKPTHFQTRDGKF